MDAGGIQSRVVTDPQGDQGQSPSFPINCNLLFLRIPNQAYKLLFVFPLQIPEKSLTSNPMYGTIIYYKESRKALGKEARI